MKKLIFGFLFIGLTSLLHSQNNGLSKNVILEPVTIKTLNLSYLKEVQSKETPEVAIALENEAARYDITEDPLFDREFEAYEVVFKAKTEGGSSGSITATYNTDGKILKSVERYKNILLPRSLRDIINEKYPGWKIHKDIYLVNYRSNRDSKKVFRVQLRKNNDKKNIKIDYKGNIQ